MRRLVAMVSEPMTWLALLTAVVGLPIAMVFARLWWMALVNIVTAPCSEVFADFVCRT